MRGLQLARSRVPAAFDDRTLAVAAQGPHKKQPIPG